MTPKQFRPIILKVVKEGKKFSSADEFVDHLIGKMDDFAEMFSMALDVMGKTTSSPTPAEEKGYTPLVITGPAEAAHPHTAPREEDASARFGAVPASGELFHEHFSKQEIFDYLQRELPPRIEVHPPLCDKPIILERRVTRSPGEAKEDMRKGGVYMNNVRVTYGIPGVDNPAELVTEYVYTTDERLDADALMQRVVTQANALYRSIQNKVPPRFAIPPPVALTVPGPDASQAEILASGAFGMATTDKNVDVTDLQAWGAPSAPEAARKYGG